MDTEKAERVDPDPKRYEEFRRRVTAEVERRAPGARCVFDFCWIQSWHLRPSEAPAPNPTTWDPFFVAWIDLGAGVVVEVFAEADGRPFDPPEDSPFYDFEHFVRAKLEDGASRLLKLGVFRTLKVRL